MNKLKKIFSKLIKVFTCFCIGFTLLFHTYIIIPIVLEMPTQVGQNLHLFMYSNLCVIVGWVFIVVIYDILYLRD